MKSKYHAKILVVDDDPDVLVSVSLFLNEYGYSTYPCNNAKDAIDKLANNGIDVVLTDIVMPGVSGIELLEEIHRLSPEVPVILMTAYADVDKAVEAIKKGAFDFIIKPYKIEQLIHSIEKAYEYHRLVKMETDYKHILEELNMEIETLMSERTMNVMALTVADRIRNPATTIAWTCKRIMEKEQISSQAMEGLNTILSEAEKLDNIVKDFHEFLKNKESMFKYDDINEVVEDIVSIVEKEASQKGVELSARISEAPLKINMEKRLMRIAVSHLLKNAVEATPKGGKIEVETFGDNSSVTVVISDTGMGISKDDVDKIFDPFFSTKSHKFGMGLPLVKQIVSEHLGDIKVESDIGKGTTFKVIFPSRWKEKISQP